MDGKICRRCLLDDMDKDEYIRSLKEYIAEYPAHKRTDDDTYRERLGICSGCDELASGICAKCGCYVELRALAPRSRCPHTPPKW